MDKHTELELIRQSVLNCRACGLREGIRAPVPMSGNKTPDVVVIGGGPSSQDIKAGIPWSGRVGYYLRGLLYEAGIQSDRIAWMNVVCCGSSPKQSHIDACRLNARRQMQALEAPYTLVLGATAVSALVPFRVTLKEMQGMWWKLGQSWTMATIDPSSAAYGYAAMAEGVLKRDLAKFATGVVFGDLHKPKLQEHCLRCEKWSSNYELGIPFCNQHVPRTHRRVKTFQQLDLLGEL